MKILKWAVLILVAVVLVTAVVVIMSVDGLVRSTVERQATSSLDLTTTLGGAHVSIFGGSVSLSDLAINSPAGFSAPHMFDLGKAAVHVSYGQLRNQPIHINTITLEKPKLVIEQSNGKLNIQSVMDHPSKTPTDSSGKTTETMKLIIDQLTIDGADVTILPGIPGMTKPIDITVPGINMANIGNDGSAQNGVAVKDVAMKVMSAIAAKCAESDKLPPELKILLSGNLGQLQTQAKEQVSKTIDAVKSGDKAQMKDAEKGLKGLLDGAKKGK